MLRWCVVEFGNERSGYEVKSCGGGITLQGPLATDSSSSRFTHHVRAVGVAQQLTRRNSDGKGWQGEINSHALLYATAHFLSPLLAFRRLVMVYCRV